MLQSPVMRLVALLFFFCPTLLFAEAGDLDTRFGNEGIVRVEVDSLIGFESPNMVVRSNDKIIVAPFLLGPDTGLLRFSSNGEQDTDFVGDIPQPPDTEENRSIEGMLIQPDDKILLIGTGGNSLEETGWDFIVYRLLPEGGRDLTFNGSGYVKVDLGGVNDLPLGLTLQPDGKIIVVGFSGTLSGKPATQEIALIRLHPEGGLDRSFGKNGIVKTDLGPEENQGLAVSLQEDGKIVVVGSIGTVLQRDGVIVRYHEDGRIDRSFGAGRGHITVELPTINKPDDNRPSPIGIVVQAGGRILVGGVVSVDRTPCPLDPTLYGLNNFFLARYRSTGFPDSSFGTGGFVQTVLGKGRTAIAEVLASQPDGKILLAGLSAHISCSYEYFDSVERFLVPDSELALIRYNFDGTIDGNEDITPRTSFGSSGIVRTPVDQGLDFISSLGFDSEGNIVVAGEWQELACPEGGSSGSCRRVRLIQERLFLARYERGALEGVADRSTTSLLFVEQLRLARVGQAKEIPFRVKNEGPADLTRVALEVTLPPRVIYNSASANCALDGTVLRCQLGSLEAGDQRIVTINVTPTTSGYPQFHATTLSKTPDPDLSNNEAICRLHVLP